MERQPMVLVVDDQPVNLKLLDLILSPRGYRVVAVGSGAEALACIAASPPDLVLLDVLMAGMDGYEVCRRLRDEPATGHLPIVLITASGEPERLKALEAGADDFIVKPFDHAELLARVRSLLRIKRYHDTIQAQAAELASLNRTLEERVQAQTREIEEARAQILTLYQELSRRHQEVYELVERLVETHGTEPRRPLDGAARPPQDGGERLTPREQDVLELLARGKTNSEIAAELVVSVATVKFHVEHIIAKLGVSDRTQAAVRAIERGLVSTRAGAV